MTLIKDGIKKVSYPSLTSEELLKQVNLTADALKKPKKSWTESESEIEGINIYMNTMTILNLIYIFLM